MRARDVFNKVKKHLLRQGKPARTTSGHCRYRTDNNLRCAVGCLIPKRAYDPKAEGVSMTGVRIINGKWAAAFHDEVGDEALARMLTRAKIPATSKVHETLEKLQDLHDTWDVDDWEERLKQLRKELKL